MSSPPEEPAATELEHATAHHEHEVTPQRLARFRRTVSSRLHSVTVVLENFWDSHNVSAVIRSAEAMGLDRVHVVESPYKYRGNRAVLRGADRWVEIRKHQSIQGCLEEVKADGFLTCAADVGEGCVELSEIPCHQPVAIVMGTERHGLSVEAKNYTDIRFTIPMHGLTESFNVSVSAAISLFDLTQRRRRHLQQPSDLSIEEMAERVQEWVDISRGVAKANI